jgi:glutathionylspermidine synthase
LLLPAYFDGPGNLTDYVKKPKLSREGANITVVRGGHTVAETAGDYGADGYVWQGLANLNVNDNANVGGKFPVLGAWVIDGESAGCGIRESDSLITDNLSRFVPHLIEQ